ncbi:hypothetical protein BDY24DRAFT_381050 [Mrakia frigida]|uniref:uncharacterized protein n=1 Tax=Mrakia frigida TaxID=29902 RepID=UPI003FCC0B0E
MAAQESSSSQVPLPSAQVLQDKPLFADPESLSSSRSPTPQPSKAIPIPIPIPHPANKHLQLDLPAPPSPTFAPSTSLGTLRSASSHSQSLNNTVNPSPAPSLKPSKSQSSKAGRKRSKSTATTSSVNSSGRPVARYPALPPTSPVDGAGHKNFEALFSLDRQPTRLPEGQGVGWAGGPMSFQDGGVEMEQVVPKEKMIEGLNEQASLAAMRRMSGEGPLDAYLPQSGPNAFSTQAYRRHPGMVFDPTSAAAIAEKEENSRIAGKTGLGWAVCVSGVCLFGFTDCCCCC